MKLLPSVLCATALAASWSYPEEGGHWAETCHDQMNGSPIDLDSNYRNFHYKHLAEADKFAFNGYETVNKWHFTDNGHSIVFTVADENHDDTTIQVDGGHLERPYNFHSFHFHWGNKKLEGGSEHTVNGRHHFAEVHLVHYGTHCETFEKCVSNDAEGVPVFHDGLAVLGAFVELDSQMNEKDINDRLRVLLTKANWLDNAGVDDTDLNKNGDFSLGEIMGGVDPTAFYRYRGSLTTPGCNEVVRWTVFKDTMKVNRRFARRFLHTVGHSGGHDLTDNYREVQHTQDRDVTFYSPDSTASKMILSGERRFTNKQKQRSAPHRSMEHEANNDPV